MATFPGERNRNCTTLNKLSFRLIFQSKFMPPLLLQDEIWTVGAQICDVVQFFNSSQFPWTDEENVKFVVRIGINVSKIRCDIRNFAHYYLFPF